MNTVPNFEIVSQSLSSNITPSHFTNQSSTAANVEPSREAKDASSLSDIERITRLALLVNLTLAIANALGGYLLGSQALIGDAVHALADLAADLVAMITASYSTIPRLEKSEAIGGLAVSGIVMSSGIALAVRSLLYTCRHFELDVLASYVNYLMIFSHDAHGMADTGSNFEVILLPLVSIMIKEWLFRATMEVAKRNESIMLESHALHQRLDAFTAVVALVVNSASYLDPRLVWLDGFGGLAIGIAIFKAGCANAVAASTQLLR
ncbi:hypothetical protein M409DRAFT_29220 [Zasmidium cellare ATCC 36951]|uniref:Cation efflux protein transmembrane domain-containing protein n=1 Tax=Zasmidium cellare ATCC 36951 TaxID=1080233 RepID=A0A6A6C3C0_ZASCE|nr:uncharacterized protein M409DRAFT_29220 [Zasmidium cellare ATCC 36951]KAF2160372.1 hypothetical protein M409DRAFT_29220 [Zasmidium cellare ATCC 36951]